MPIRVAPGAADTICDFADGFVLHVTETPQVEAARTALGHVAKDLARLAVGPASLSNPVLAPGGPLLRVAGLGVDDDVLRTIPDRVVRRLGEAGITDAVVDSPEPGGHLDRLDGCACAVVLRLFPAPAGESGALPSSWIDIAAEWALGDLPPDATVPLRLLGAGFDLAVADAPSILHQACSARVWCDVVNGDLDDRIRTASITFGRAPHVALAAGGPGCDDHALLARYDLLCEVAREMAPDVAYACVDFEATFEGIGLGLVASPWQAEGGAAANVIAGALVDELVPDAYPYQLLGKGHLGRLGDHEVGLGSSLGAEVAPGKVEVSLGTATDWLSDSDERDEARAEGWEVLAPLLLTESAADDLLGTKPERLDERTAPPPRVVDAGLPNLADITLEVVPHARRSLHLTFLELVSWLAHDHHSDAPRSVSPVLATYARWFASALDDRRRQELKGRAVRFVGTADGAPPRGPGRTTRLTITDLARAWCATDWLVRVQAPRWLHLAGLDEPAARVEALSPTSDRTELVRAVDVLGEAIAIVGRRIDLTSSIAATDLASDAELVEHAAWDAWEEASEMSGWVAASEAAGVGVPSDLAYATDVRVIECARDERARAELDAHSTTIGDAAWAAALHAMATEAWDSGWAAAGPAVDDLAVLPLRTALDRATRAARVAAADLEEEDSERAEEQAEAAAKDVLTRSILDPAGWPQGEHPWDAALEAARTAEGAAAWARVQHLARAAVDEGPWDAGMAAARSTVDDILTEAPDLVARSVGAAVAREAAGAAARSVALRAAAVARAQGADAAATKAAARRSLAPTAADLQDAALALLDDLVDPVVG